VGEEEEKKKKKKKKKKRTARRTVSTALATSAPWSLALPSGTR
jgi:hypothetical protein